MKKKKFINVLSRVNDLRNNFVYQMFNEIIIDPKTKEPVVTKQKITEFKVFIFFIFSKAFSSKYLLSLSMKNGDKDYLQTL